MLWIADISSQRPLAPSCEGSANAPKTEVRLRAQSAPVRWKGRAPHSRSPGRPCGTSALPYRRGAKRSRCVPGASAGRLPTCPELSRRVRCLSRSMYSQPTWCIRTILRHKRLAPSESEGSLQVSAFRRPQAASPHSHKLPTCRPGHPVSARHTLPIRATSNLRRISDFRFSNRQFSKRSVSVLESAYSAGASHTLPCQIHCPKGSR